MEYSNELLMKMSERRKLNKQYSIWLTKYAKELGLKLREGVDERTGEFILYPDKKSASNSFAPYNRAERMKHCLDYWQWNVYHNAKIMDLQIVSRCKDVRFCPNCKVLETAKYIHKVSSIYREVKAS